MVAAGSKSTAVRSIPESASVPERGCRANWYGRVAPSNVRANIRARLRDTRRWKVLPVEMPRTPPSRFAERSEVGEAQSGSEVGKTRGREEVGCVREQLDRPGVA